MAIRKCLLTESHSVAGTIVIITVVILRKSCYMLPVTAAFFFSFFLLSQRKKSSGAFSTWISSFLTYWHPQKILPTSLMHFFSVWTRIFLASCLRQFQIWDLISMVIMAGVCNRQPHKVGFKKLLYQSARRWRVKFLHERRALSDRLFQVFWLASII